MAAITVQKAVEAGIVPSFVACNAGGDTFINDGKTYIYVKNADSSSHDVTLTAYGKCNQGYLHDLVVAVGASEEKIIGPFLPERFNSSGSASLTYSAVTSMTIAAVK